MDLPSMLVYGVLILIALLALGALIAPVRWGVKLLVNACFGIFGLIVTGVFGSLIGLTLSINVLTVLLTALLGVPGLALVVLLHILF